MFSSIKLWITIGVIGALGLSGFLAWNYYKSTQLELKTLAMKNAQLEITVETTKKALDDLEKFNKQQLVYVNELNTALTKSEEPLRDLQKIFAKHSLVMLAKDKPGLIEKRINDATNEVFRAIECDTGDCLR